MHTLPAVTDLAAQGAHIDWVVEEAFAPIAAAHPGVRRVIPIAWRRWRRQLPAFWRAESAAARQALGAFRASLKSTDYDLVIDAQGLYKSAVVAQQARARRKVGLDRNSAREPGAARFYTQTVAVERAQHAVDRVRQLVACAADYTLTEQLDFGLDRQDAASPDGPPVCLLLHGTTWSTKHYPESLWIELAELASAAGYQPALTWGDAAEQSRAERIAGSTGAQVWPRVSLAELIERLRSTALVIGVDSGIAHLCGALGVPTVGLYGATNATLTGVRGARSHNLAAQFACAPCLRRTCTYAGAPVLHRQKALVPACYSTLLPASVWQAAQQLVAH